MVGFRNDDDAPVLGQGVRFGERMGGRGGGQLPGALAIHVTVKSVGACKTIKLAYTIFCNKFVKRANPAFTSNRN